jgi:hypothetical protein
MRRLAILPALGLAAALCLPATPASAQGVGAFTGTVHLDCFGCGVSNGTASMTYVEAGTSVIALGSRNAAMNVRSPILGSCLVESTMNGDIAGVVNREFHWTVLGAVLVVTEWEADRAYWGAGTFVITSPVGIPCGSQVDAVVVAALETLDP